MEKGLSQIKKLLELKEIQIKKLRDFIGEFHCRDIKNFSRGPIC